MSIQTYFFEGGGRGGARGGGKPKGGGGKKGGNVILEPHRHRGIFIAKGKEHLLVTTVE